MDSNLINIDDLVKQRLSGGEERERSGSWQRMQALLEQEERKKPFGMIFWRRAMSTAGVVLVLALLTAGGYEVTTAFRGNADAEIAGNNATPGQEAHNIASAVAANEKATNAVNPAATTEEGIVKQGANTTNNTAAANGSAPTVDAKAATAAVNTTAKHPAEAPAATAAKHGNAAGATASHTGNAVVNSAITAAGNTHTTVTSGTQPVNTKAINTPSGSHEALQPAIGKATAANHPTMGSATNKGASTTGGNNKAVDNAANNAGLENTPLSAGLSTNGNTPNPSATKNAGHAVAKKHTTANTVNSHANVNTAKANTIDNNNGKSTLASAVTTVANTNGQPANAAGTQNAASSATGKGTQPTATTAKGTAQTTASHGTAGKATNNNHVAQGANVGTTVKASAPKNTTATISEATGQDEEATASVAKGNKKATTTAATPATAGNAKGNKKSVKINTAQTSNTPAEVGSLPLGSATTTAPSTVKHSTTPAITHVTAINAKAANKAGNSKTAANNGLSTVNAVATPAATPAKAAKQEIVSKKVVQKIETHQSTTGNYPGRLQMHNDTISNDKVTVETRKTVGEDAPEEDAPTTTGTLASTTTIAPVKGSVAKTTSHSTSRKGNPATSATTTGSNAGSSASSVATTTSSKPAAPAVATAKGRQPQVLASIKPVVPHVAAMPPFAAPAPKAANLPKQTPINPAADEDGNGLIADKKKGAIFMQSLMKAFNDVKYKIGSAHFSPGLTAGIDGTFFGPNSCKGFQFGVVGNFELDEKWSFMSELKYFHRMNNTFSLMVNYDKYEAATVNGINGYSKENTDVNYSFSTLHSFELPLSLRYAAGKLGFFGGCNFAYSLPVNISRELISHDPLNNPTQFVTAIGPNSTPSLQVSDFGGRFGIGYLFGVSYKIAPNMSLDFRNAQTVWDNAKNDASKNVSNQLFKSPSLQFSLIYRFGTSDKD
jgi:hypothetical protein